MVTTILQRFTKYIELRLEYIGASVQKSVLEMLAVFLLLLIVVFLLLVGVVLALIGVGWYIGTLLGAPHWGLLLVAWVFLVAGAVALLRRRRIILYLYDQIEQQVGEHFLNLAYGAPQSLETLNTDTDPNTPKQDAKP